jgi:hypothetical protein
MGCSSCTIVTRTFSDRGSPRELGSFVLMSRVHPLDFITKNLDNKFSLTTFTLIYWGLGNGTLVSLSYVSLLVSTFIYQGFTPVLLSTLRLIKLLLGFTPSNRMEGGKGSCCLG